ncbi:MAG: hypothetical protein IS860_07665 [Nitrosopumilus sp.]|nr:hypothetical protein [Nitrosopumilus sp.]
MVNSNDRIIVADNGIDLVQIFDSTGSFLSDFDGTDGGGTAFDVPVSVFVDSDDRIIVADNGLDLVQIFEGFATSGGGGN